MSRGGLRRRVADELRQRGQHAAFRIAAPELDPAWLRRALADLVARPAARDDGAFADAGTGVWRARRKLAQLAEENRTARQAGRQLDRAERALAEAGLVIQDHDGAPYHPGLALEVVAMVDDPEVPTPTVVETIRPSIYLDDRPIQVGQVVVGNPAGKEDSRAGND